MATNPYTSQSISGYNANPPPDDDTTGSDNQVEWAKHKTKLGDPNKTLSEGINTAALSMGTKVINTDADEANTVAGTIAYTTSELTISGGSITPTKTNHTVDTQSDDAADDLATLATGSVNDRAVVALKTENVARVVTVKNAAGNINLMNNTDVVLDIEVPLVLQRNGADWEEISRPTQDLETTADATFNSLTTSGINFIGDSANAKMTVGQTINQGANDDEIYALKSSDVAHGVTDITETDTFGFMLKSTGTTGGMRIGGVKEAGQSALFLAGYGPSPGTTPQTNAVGIITCDGYETSGTGLTNAAANALIFSVRSQVGGVTKALFFVDEDGDLHVNGSSTLATFDTHNDAELVAGLRGALMSPEQAAKDGLALYAANARQTLEENKIITYNDDGRHFLNTNNALFLAMDAARQAHNLAKAALEVLAEIDPASRGKVQAKLQQKKMPDLGI